MFQFTIDTDSKKLSAVDVYTSSAKTEQIPMPLDVIGRFKHSVKVIFTGSKIPKPDDSVKMVIAWNSEPNNTTGAATYIEHTGSVSNENPAEWVFSVDFKSATLEAALSKQKKITTRGAVVVESADTHVEYHYTVGMNASIYAGAAEDPGETEIAEFVRVIRTSWEAYQTLPQLDENTLYVVSDAPSNTYTKSEIDEQLNAFAKLSGANTFSGEQTFSTETSAIITTLSENGTHIDDKTATSNRGTRNRVTIAPSGITISYHPDDRPPMGSPVTTIEHDAITTGTLNLSSRTIKTTTASGIVLLSAQFQPTGGEYIVVGDTVEQTLTNKDISDASNTYRDATAELNGAVKIAPAIKTGDSRVVTSDQVATQFLTLGTNIANAFISFTSQALPLTNKNLSDNSNTYRDATAELNGAVKIAPAITPGDSRVVTSDIVAAKLQALESRIAALEAQINAT